MELETVTFGKVKKWLPKRKITAHKGDNGKALVIGGSDLYSGAPILAVQSCIATLRSGTDLCTLAAPSKVGWVAATYNQDIIVKKFDGAYFAPRHLQKILALESKMNATLIGPGIGTEMATFEFVEKFAKKAKGKIIFDADAIKAYAGKKFAHKVAITPNFNEFKIFTGITVSEKMGDSVRGKIVKNAARKYNCCILLKGVHDIISDGKRVFVNKTGEARMSVGGTGDILSGLVTGFTAYGLDLLKATCSAAFINGKIGEALHHEMGNSYLASDFLEKMPKLLKRVAK